VEKQNTWHTTAPTRNRNHNSNHKVLSVTNTSRTNPIVPTNRSYALESGQQKSYNKPRTPFARIAQFLDSDDEEDEEDTVVNTVTTSKSGNTELKISDIAACTSHFTDDQHEEWVKEMKNLGVDF
jgi:hypothetical protein